MTVTIAAQDSLEAEMRHCEEALLHTDFSATPQVLESMLAPGFVEVASGGRSSDRAAVIHWLLRKDPAARWQLNDLSATEPAPGLRLVLYHARQVLPQPSAGRGALHYSLWSFNADVQHWQLRFHQATKIS